MSHICPNRHQRVKSKISTKWWWSISSRFDYYPKKWSTQPIASDKRGFVKVSLRWTLGWLLCWDLPWFEAVKAPFVNYSVWDISAKKCLLDSLNHIHIWQVTAQLFYGKSIRQYEFLKLNRWIFFLKFGNKGTHRRMGVWFSGSNPWCLSTVWWSSATNGK